VLRAVMTGKGGAHESARKRLTPIHYVDPPIPARRRERAGPPT
jgi:hypothetical protein